MPYAFPQYTVGAADRMQDPTEFAKILEARNAALEKHKRTTSAPPMKPAPSGSFGHSAQSGTTSNAGANTSKFTDFQPPRGTERAEKLRTPESDSGGDPPLGLPIKNGTPFDVVPSDFLGQSGLPSTRPQKPPGFTGRAEDYTIFKRDFASFLRRWQCQDLLTAGSQDLRMEWAYDMLRESVQLNQKFDSRTVIASEATRRRIIDLIDMAKPPTLCTAFTILDKRFGYTATAPNREKFLTMLDHCYQRDQLFSDWFATFMRLATDYRALQGELTDEMLLNKLERNASTREPRPGSQSWRTRIETARTLFKENFDDIITHLEKLENRDPNKAPLRPGGRDLKVSHRQLHHAFATLDRVGTCWGCFKKGHFFLDKNPDGTYSSLTRLMPKVIRQ
ncbi:hypothetical protein NFJ02_19g34900 [Pycnococcus provasolii]